jgi:hypothetical protein
VKHRKNNFYYKVQTSFNQANSYKLWTRLDFDKVKSYVDYQADPVVLTFPWPLLGFFGQKDVSGFCPAFVSG